MVTLDQIRKDITILYKNEINLRYVDVNASSVEEALADAALQLDTSVKALEYEVLETGFNGVMGLMRRPWLLRIYENETARSKRSKMAAGSDLFGEEAEVAVESLDKDGMYYIRRFGSQVFLKVVPPVANGSPVALAEVMSQVDNGVVIELKKDLVKNSVKKGTKGEYVDIGHFEHIQAADATFYSDISNDEMSVCINAQQPGKGGADIEFQQVMRQLTTQGVTHGINEEKIQEFVDNPVYGTPFVVAEGIPAVNGRDAYISYKFETDKTKLRAKESASGQINFKELNTIQNVVEGQPLAQKMLAERGKAGKTVKGRYLEATNGKDIKIPLGKNVSIDPADKRTIVADINGQVLLDNNRVTVEPVLEVDEVSLKASNGNITFNGTVIVRKNVQDGFNVKATGNIEVGGTVGNGIVEADGDIIVSLGIRGKEQGTIKAGKSILAKFIENATVFAEENVVVTDGIINSRVTANKKIIVNGSKRAAIVGGHLFATEEIRAKNIGSVGGNETILEVGYDPRAKQRLDELNRKNHEAQKELEEINLDIATLENQKKIRRHLSPDKEQKLGELKNTREDIIVASDDMHVEIEEIQAHLRELKVVGKVFASGTIYAGVKIWVRDIKDEFKNDVKSVTVYAENGYPQHGKYEEPKDNADIRIPDGYSAN
ncbi:MAG TPA: FapA family protein [Treponemataceae bacterium]|nr:FapA family protein [Treponemataceae bacterium]